MKTRIVTPFILLLLLPCFAYAEGGVKALEFMITLLTIAAGMLAFSFATAIIYLIKRNWSYFILSFIPSLLVLALGGLFMLAVPDHGFSPFNLIALPPLAILSLLIYGTIRKYPTQLLWYAALNSTLLAVLLFTASTFLVLRHITFLDYAVYILSSYFYTRALLKKVPPADLKRIFINISLLTILTVSGAHFAFLFTAYYLDFIRQDPFTFIKNLLFSLLLFIALANLTAFITIRINKHDNGD